MSTDHDSTRPRVAFLSGVLAASLTAAFANLTASSLDGPRAFRSLGAMSEPLAITLVLFLVVCAVLVLALRPVARRAGGELGMLAAVGGLAVFVGALWPFFEVLERDMSAERAPALWVLVLALLVLVPLSLYLLMERIGRSAPVCTHGPWLGLAMPLVALELLGLVWFVEYQLAGSLPGARAVAMAIFGVVAALTLFACLRWRERLPRTGLLAGLAVLTLATPLPGLILGESTPASRATGQLPDGAPERVVLITVDTLRPDMIAAAGEHAAETPAIAALFDDSIVFENARSAAPWTKPSLATMLTGLSPLVHRTVNRRALLPDGVSTLAESMRDAGYRTAGLGLNVHLEELFRFDQGFDEYFFPARDDYGLSFGAKVLECLDPDRYPEVFPSTEAICDVAVDWIEANADERFFLWIHILDPHWPYAPPEHLVPEATAGSRIGGFWGDPGMVTNIQAGNTKLGEADRERVRELYRGEIRYTDENVARVVQCLKNRKLYDGALIAFASDHGEEFWEHGTFEHGHTMYDEVLRVPLAFKLPGSAATGRLQGHVSTESLTPTLLDLVDPALAKAEQFTSPSLRPHWSGEVSEQGVLYATATYYHGQKYMVLMDGRWKYVLDEETGRETLFDLESDPGEKTTRAAAEPVVLDRARGLLSSWLESADAMREKLELVDEELDSMSEAASQRLRKLGYGGGD